MSFRNLDSAHDWTWGANKSNYVNANQEIGLNLETRILSFSVIVFLLPMRV